MAVRGRHEAALALRRGLAAAASGSWARARRELATAVLGDGPGAVWAVQELVQSYLARAEVARAEAWLSARLPAGSLRDHALGYLYRRTGRRAEAAVRFRRALAAQPREWAAASELATVLRDQGRPRAGVTLLAQAEEHFRRRRDLWGLSTVLAHRARRALEGLELKEAVRLHERALRLKRACGDRVGEGAVLHNLGLAHYYLTDYTKALARLAEALAIQRARSDLRGAAFTLNTLGMVDLDTANPSEASVFLRESVRLFRRVRDRRGEAGALANLGYARRLGGDLAGAVRHYRAASDLERSSGGSDHGGMTVANLALTLTARGQPRAALNALAACPPAARRLADARTRLVLRRERARALLALGAASAAARTLRLALAEMGHRARDRDAALLDVLEARCLEAEAALVRGRTATALLIVRQASRRLERLLRRHRTGSIRMGLLETLRRIHDLWLHSLSRDRRRFLWPAWRVAASLKARETQGMTSPLARHAAAGGRVSPPGGNRARLRSLAPDEALIEYHVSPETTYVFVGSRAGATWIDLGLTEKRLGVAIAALLEPLRAAGASADSAVDLGRFDPARAVALHRRLMAPVLACLAPRIRRLALVPHGPLHGLPFEVLAERGPAGRVRYLAETHDVGYLPSSLTVGRARGRRGARGMLLALAPAAGQSWPGCGLAAEGRLAAARREVAAVAQGFGRRKLLVGRDATVAAFERWAPRADIVHIAAHARADLVESARSAIVLAGGSAHDGLLTAARIGGMRLRPALVVLSACESQAGRSRLHEGLQGLARAFLIAGADTVVASFWRVDDEATRRLMRELYRGLGRGLTLDAALGAARTALRRAGYEHPYYWAAFVAIGPGAMAPATAAVAGRSD